MMTLLRLVAWRTHSCLLIALAICGSHPGGAAQRNEGDIAQPVRDHQVLTLLSYHLGQEWNDRVLEGLQSVLADRDDIEVSYEYLDTKRHVTGAHLLPLRELLRVKYAGHAPACIIAVDDFALDFALELRSALWPGVPVAFCGINDENPARFTDQAAVTGVFERVDLNGTLNLALHLHPATRRVVLLHDQTQVGLAMRDQFAALGPSHPHVTLDFLTELSFAALEDELRTLPDDTVVILTHYLVDTQGSILTPTESAKHTSAACRVPVYTVWDFLVEAGAVGGVVVDGHAQGAAAARFAVQLLAGTPLEQLPMQHTSPNSTLLNYPQMQRFGIRRTALPPQAIVLNEPVSLYQRYRQWVWSAVAFVGLQSALIALLVWNRTRLRHARDEVLAAEQRLELALEGGNLGLWDWDLRTGRIVRNDHWAALLGYDLSEIPPDTSAWEQLRHPEDAPAAMKAMAAHLRGRTPLYESQQRLRTRAGGWKWVLERGKITARSPEGTPLRVTGTLSDIATQKAAEESLRASFAVQQRMAQRQAAILDALPAHLCVLDRDGVIVAVNRAWRQFARLPLDAGINLTRDVGRNYLAICDAVQDDGRTLAQIVAAGLRDVLAGRRDAFTLEYPCHATEQQQWFRLIVAGLPAEAGGAVVMHLDVTERRQAMETLRESEALHRGVLENAPVGVFQTTPAGHLIFANRALARLLGYSSAAELLAAASHRTIGELAYADPQERTQIISMALLTEGWRRFETRFRRKDGVEIVVSLRLHAVWDARRENAELYGFVEDITETKRAEEERRRLDTQIQHAQKLESLGVLAGGVAHDFNNLLVGMLGHADLALAEIHEDGPVRMHLLGIEQAARHAADLVRQMLAYSGRGRFIIQAVNLNELVAGMLQLLEVTIPKTVTLQREFATHLPPVEGDVTQLRQVVMNLVTNAAEAIGQKPGTIRIRTGVRYCDEAFLQAGYLNDELPAGHYAFLEIQDDGCGMDTETRARMFDPFFTTKFTGRGLGLAAVLGIIRGHCGSLQVESAPGAGSTFQVLFPAAETAAFPETRPPVQPAETPHGVVLLVDDDETVRNVGQRMLERAGLTVLTAEDGQDAVEKFRDRAMDIGCVILDLTMPRMNGEEALRALRAIRADVPVILSSGYDEEDLHARFAEADLAGFIQKPYYYEDLLACLRRALPAG